MILFDASLLEAVLRFVAPLLLAALGGLLCERVGVWNVGLEGLMLGGAFAAVACSYATGSATIGVLGAAGAGVVLATLMALFAVTLRGHPIVVGIALNLLASGLTVFLLRAWFGVKGAFQDPRVDGLDPLRLPGIDAIPVLGPLLSGHTVLVYLALLLVPLIHLLLFRHPWGLRLRAVGEHPQAAATLGIRTDLWRWAAVLASGALCGLAGAQLSLGNVTLFVDGMSAGRGWIAVVAVLVARAHPLGVLVACCVFGLVDALGFRLQGYDLPSQLVESLPYLATLAGLAIVGYRRQRTLDRTVA